jgi:Tol biopolymer transport system component
MTVRLMLLVAPLLALTVVEDRPHAQLSSRRDGRITVVVGESGESIPSPRLLLMDADGKNRRGRGKYVNYAALAPNGRLIAYELLGTRNTRVMAADGPPRDRLLVRNGEWADWSARGDAVAFVRGGDIWIDNLGNSKQRRVVRDGNWPDWSPDGKRLAFVRERTSSRSGSAARDIWAVDLATRRERRLIRGGDAPRWSPDGHWIAFTRMKVYESFIYVAHADGTAQRHVAEGEDAAWSPDGSELAIADFYRITRMRPDGTHRRIVFGSKAIPCPACRFVDWSR